MITKYDLLAFLQHNCKGHANRLKGKEMQDRLGINYKILSNVFNELQEAGYPVFNYKNQGYFYAIESDIDYLIELGKITDHKHVKIARRKRTISETVKSLKNGEL
jgi:hypothetical protein